MDGKRWSVPLFNDFVSRWLPRGTIPTLPLTIVLAAIVGIAAGFSSVVFSWIIAAVDNCSVEPLLTWAATNSWWLALLCLCPAAGLVVVSWFTTRFAPEAEGHGVPEVIEAMARRDGVIRARVSVVKLLASGVCIGTGGSVGREGPIVQIGAAVGSLAGQIFRLSAPNVKLLVASGAAAGISSTFHAPLAGVMFASEIVLGNFAVESLTPIVVSSVLADVVQTRFGERGAHAAFPLLDYHFAGAWEQLPSFVVLGLLTGAAAIGFTKLLYWTEDVSQKWLRQFWMRALVLGLIVGVLGIAFRSPPTFRSRSADRAAAAHEVYMPPLFGMGYPAIDHALHLRMKDRLTPKEAESEKVVALGFGDLLAEFWWILPLALLKPVVTSLTLSGGGSGGIFAPSLFLGAATGASFGLFCNAIVPEWSADPGVYAIVGMGAGVAGTTHGILSAILIVYEMTDNYDVILPIMVAAGLASLIAKMIDPDSIYYKKLSRRNELIARGHDMHRLEHIMVRDVMLRHFPTVRNTDSADEIIRVARRNPHIECLPVMDRNNVLVGLIRPEDLHRVLDTDLDPRLLKAEDIALMTPVTVDPDANLLEALRDFGSRDVEMLPVVSSSGGDRRIVGVLLRTEVMRRYRQELLKR